VKDEVEERELGGGEGEKMEVEEKVS